MKAIKLGFYKGTENYFFWKLFNWINGQDRTPFFLSDFFTKMFNVTYQGQLTVISNPKYFLFFIKIISLMEIVSFFRALPKQHKMTFTNI